MKRLLLGAFASAYILLSAVFLAPVVTSLNAEDLDEDLLTTPERAALIAEINSNTILLYDSAVELRHNKKEELEREQEEKASAEEAPSNVAFVEETDDQPEGTELDEKNAANGSETDELIMELGDEEASLELLNPTPPNEDDATLCDVLVDMRHAHDFSDYPLAVDDRHYHRIYSFHRAFEYLKTRGVQVRKYDSNEPLTPQTLERCKTLFMNLPSGDKAPFFVSEILAIREFVENGGSLFLITDHSNCYFHQSRLHPLFHELDVKPQTYTVCDVEQKLGSSGVGWIYIDKFDAHPLTQGLRQIAFQTGGGVDPRFAVAWSGPSSWQDAAMIPLYGEADVAYFGNFIKDANEPIGSSGVVLAKTWKKGKIVIVGDQNLFSPFFLQYLDVYRLWINAFAWTLERPELADVGEYVKNANQGRVVLCWEELGRDAARFGDPDPLGYYHLYTFLCRYYNTFCVAHDDPWLESEVLVVLHGDENYSQEGFDYAYKQLHEGKTLIVVDPQADVINNEKTALSTLLKKLKEEAGIGADATEKTTGKKYVELLKLTNGGRVVLVRGKDSLNNSTIPKPEARLLFVQAENVKTLLREIDSALEAKTQSLDVGESQTVSEEKDASLEE